MPLVMGMPLFGYYLLMLEISVTASHRAKIWPGLCGVERREDLLSSHVQILIQL